MCIYSFVAWNETPDWEVFGVTIFADFVNSQVVGVICTPELLFFSLLLAWEMEHPSGVVDVVLDAAVVAKCEGVEELIEVANSLQAPVVLVTCKRSRYSAR